MDREECLPKEEILKLREGLSGDIRAHSFGHLVAQSREKSCSHWVRCGREQASRAKLKTVTVCVLSLWPNTEPKKEVSVKNYVFITQTVVTGPKVSGAGSPFTAKAWEQSFVFLTAGIPAPVYFGVLIDTSCLKWGFKKCGSRGSCRLYDSHAFRYSANPLCASYFLPHPWSLDFPRSFPCSWGKSTKNCQQFCYLRLKFYPVLTFLIRHYTISYFLKSAYKVMHSWMYFIMTLSHICIIMLFFEFLPATSNHVSITIYDENAQVRWLTPVIPEFGGAKRG